MRTSPDGRHRVISDACSLLEEWTGFDLRETTPHRIADAFGRRATELGYDHPLAYLRQLRTQAPTDDEPQRLINLITNGLTAFWRDEPQLSALRSILNHLRDVRGGRPITIWCAGVSTGEEAYTAAIIAHEEGVPVTILGTDINTDTLAAAREGIFSEWSLRRLSEDRRRQFLRRHDKHHFLARHAAFQDLRFQRHNLLASPPSSPAADGTWDVILCRNVLIYFSPDAMERALRRMADSLSPEGYLLFGSSEQISTDRMGPDAPHLRPLRHGAGFVYRPGKTRTGHTIQPGHIAFSAAPAGDPIIHAPGPIEPSGLDETTSDAGESGTVNDLLHAGAEHLRQGDLEDALACFEACLGYDPFHVECHCLMGAILQAIGATHQALEAFQKALFLAPRHWFAAHRTAVLHELRHDDDAARLAHKRTLEGLARHADPLDTSFVLRDLLTPVTGLREHAELRAREFLHDLPE